MNARPLRSHPLPAYPTRIAVLADPELLEKHTPAAWQASGEMAGAMAVFLAANLLGCSKESPTTASRPPAAAPDEQKPAAEPAAQQPAQQALSPDVAAVVAPIFEHGEGRATDGCEVIVPPVYLSEDAALQVIREELEKAGVKITETNVVLDGVEVPKRQYHYEPGETTIEETGTSALALDVKDGAHKIGVEYVSVGDYGALGGVASMSSVQGYDFKEVAGVVAEQVRKQGKGVYFGALYDPGMPAYPRYDGNEDDATRQKREQEWHEAAGAWTPEKSKELLRAQVQDFVQWLRDQGALPAEEAVEAAPAAPPEAP